MRGVVRGVVGGVVGGVQGGSFKDHKSLLCAFTDRAHTHTHNSLTPPHPQLPTPLPCVGAFITTVLPAINAGPILDTAKLRG